VRVCELADVARIGHTACKVEAARGVKLVLCDALRVADQSRGRMLQADELEKGLGADAGLVGERRALCEQLDEAELKGVANEPGCQLEPSYPLT
jgi:hypothetical protein